MLSLIVIAIVAAVGILLASDANISLYLAPSPPPNAFKDKVVWVVGASSGIGAQLAEDFSKQSAKVILSSRRVDMLNVLAEKCTDLYTKSISYGATTTSSDSLSPAALVLPLDITKYEDHEKAFAEVLSVYGRIDVLVLNAGVDQASEAIETSFETTEYLMKLNFLSYVALTKAVLPSMVKQKSGKIVVMSSLAGIIGTPLSSSYSATKFALNGYFSALRSEVSPDNVEVSIVCPGPVASEIFTKTLQAETKAVLADDVMPTDRCTSLIIKGLYHGIDEMWISRHPVLLIAHIYQYLPNVGRKIFKDLVGPARVYALKNGRGIFDPTVLPEYLKKKFSGSL